MTGLPPRDYAYYRRALAGQRLPAAFIDLDCLDANLDSLRRRAGALPIRLVTKSIRSVAIIRRLLDADPLMRGLLCYSPAEAAWLAEQGFDDLVVAYPSVEPSEIGAVAQQIRAGRSITLMVDNPSQLGRLAGVLAVESARRVHLRLDGLMGYEGQIAGLMDDVPGRNFKNRIVRFLKHR